MPEPLQEVRAGVYAGEPVVMMAASAVDFRLLRAIQVAVEMERVAFSAPVSLQVFQPTVGLCLLRLNTPWCEVTLHLLR